MREQVHNEQLSAALAIAKAKTTNENRFRCRINTANHHIVFALFRNSSSGFVVASSIYRMNEWNFPNALSLSLSPIHQSSTSVLSIETVSKLSKSDRFCLHKSQQPTHTQFPLDSFAALFTSARVYHNVQKLSHPRNDALFIINCDDDNTFITSIRRSLYLHTMSRRRRPFTCCRCEIDFCMIRCAPPSHSIRFADQSVR